MEVRAGLGGMANIVKQEGFDGLFKALSERFPQLGLYEMSTDWYTYREGNTSPYILKAKGKRGDLIIRWI
jgi:hypothetical protein